MMEKRWCWTLPAYLALVLVIIVAVREALVPVSDPPLLLPRSGPPLCSLIDLTNFTFLHSTACNSSSSTYVTLVISAPWNIYNREEIRRTWGRPGEVVFLLGSTNTTWQSIIDRESRDYGDIVQGSFVDSYRNLTYKHVMGLLWAQKKCEGTPFILKVDDDVFVNTPYLINYITRLTPFRLILCPAMERTLVKRSYRSKWRVSPDEYPDRWYPRYCSGWVVLYSSDVVSTLSTAAQVEPYFWIDDVHITGTLAIKANFSRIDLKELGLGELKTEELLSSHEIKSDFLFALTKPQNFQTLWNMVKSESRKEKLL